HLTKYIVQTHVAAYRHGLRIVDSHAENTYRIETPLGPLFPDRRLTIVSPIGSRFTNCIELDNSTESLVSATSVDSIELKIKKYLHDLAACNYGYRVQFVVTRSSRRAQHIRQLVMRHQPQVRFAPFYVVSLDEYLSAENPFLKPIFASANAKRIGLLRVEAASLLQHKNKQPATLLPAPALC
ncbi:MAG: hypothetical protein KDA93_25080, partial [Planctomycetaceae bacterium]|nr:hypothetical protein [Planctomycetaceae bacterium]